MITCRRPMPNPILHGAFDVPTVRQVPRHRRPVYPAVVVSVVGLLDEVVVVPQTELIAHVDQRQTAKSQDQAVGQQIPANGQVEVDVVTADQGCLDASQ